VAVVIAGVVTFLFVRWRKDQRRGTAQFASAEGEPPPYEPT